MICFRCGSTDIVASSGSGALAFDACPAHAEELLLMHFTPDELAEFMAAVRAAPTRSIVEGTDFLREPPL